MRRWSPRYRGRLITDFRRAEDRLVLVQNPDGTANTYLYSADGKRQKQITAAGTVNFVRDGENVLLETDANLITQAHYTDFPGAWGGLASERRGSSSSFYLFDSQSSARDLVSAAGAVTDSYVYKAFGEELSVGGATANPFRFGGLAGYYRDTPSRLYVRARHLRTDLGRWLSRDPAGGGPPDNPYGYAEGNPVTGLDPSGRLTILAAVPGQWVLGPSADPACCCGKFRALWQFQLDYPNHTSRVNGWIVQEVWLDLVTTPCPLKPPAIHSHYLEVWPMVQHDHPHPGGWNGQYDDVFCNGQLMTDQRSFLLPGIRIRGVAKYLEAGVGGVPADLNGLIAQGFTNAGKECNDHAGALYCRNIPPRAPDWWTRNDSADGTSGAHSAWSWWCCCHSDLFPHHWSSNSSATPKADMPGRECGDFPCP